MKKVLITTLLCTFSVSSMYAQVADTQWRNKPIQCGTTEEVVDTLKGVGEDPFVWMDGKATNSKGVSADTRFVIAMNPKTLGWTLLEFVQSGTMVCILGSGQSKINMNTLDEKKKGIDI